MFKKIKNLLGLRIFRFLIFANLAFLTFFASFALIRNNVLEQEIQRATGELENECNDLLIAAQSAEHYISSKLRDIFWGNWQDCEKLRARTEEFLDQIGIEAKIIVWDKSCKISCCNFDYLPQQEGWQLVFKFLHEFRVEEKHRMLNQQPESMLINARKLLGPLFSPMQIFSCVASNNPGFISTSFSTKHPKLWLHAFHNGGIILFFSPEAQKSFDPLRFEIMQKNKRNGPVSFFLLNEATLFPADQEFSNRYASILNDFLRLNYKLEQRTNDSSFLCRQFRDKEKLVGHLIHSKLIANQMQKDIEPFFIFAFFNLIAFSAAIFMPIIDSKKIKARLLVFFTASGLLPLLAYTGFAIDYIHEYRNARLTDKNQQSLKFLQMIDEGSNLAYSDQITTLRKSLPHLLKNLEKDGITKKSVVDLLLLQKPRLRGMFLVGSATREIATDDAVLTRDKVLEIIEWPDKLPFGPDKITQSKAFDIIFKALLASLNGKSITNKQGIEMEMVLDSIGQSDYTVLVQSYFESLDSIWRYGFGRDQFPMFITLLKKNDYDYNFLAILHERLLALHFAEKKFTSLNRNNFGLKILFKISGRKFIPEEFQNNHNLIHLLETSHKNRSGLPLIIDLEGKNHSVTILYCHHNPNLKLMAVYPLDEIDAEIHRLSRNFILAGILGFLTVIGMGLLVSGPVLNPIMELKAGVVALQSRNFNFRLSDLGKNEFGHLAQIFNQTLENTQELHVASLVQEKLIPQFESTQRNGNWLFFGKTQSLDDLGGDYFDLVKTHNGRTGILLGDVAGHGVAASLIVAFVKAAIIRLENLYDRPQLFFNRLNLLFRQTQAKKQKKFMSLQYLLFNDNDKTFSFLNAGHCFPIIVDSLQKTTTFLSMINSPLGTTRKDYPEAENQELKPGQALVMFSDGCYEMPGMDLEKFQKVLLESFDREPKKFFDNVNEYFDRHGLIQQSDDKTLLIVSRDIE